ncbi:MAG: HK97 family phage prohead protease [Holosporales bacterium]|jgi:HK97 family phage prohead protease|nr:HK97 family phage prohead protease [Holosporales bacterium]
MNFINYPMQIKSLDQTGALEGYASVFGTVDLQNEVVQPGAFEASLATWKQNSCFPKMLWQHDPKSPIGVWDDMFEDQYGLYVRGRLLLDLQKGRDAYSLIKSGAVDGLSIGFMPKQSHKDGDVRVLDEVDLFEVSLVTFMANPLAKVTSCKHWSDAYDQTIYLMNRLKSLKRAMDKTDWHVKSLMMEQV